MFPHESRYPDSLQSPPTLNLCLANGTLANANQAEACTLGDILWLLGTQTTEEAKANLLHSERPQGGRSQISG